MRERRIKFGKKWEGLGSRVFMEVLVLSWNRSIFFFEVWGFGGYGYRYVDGIGSGSIRDESIYRVVVRVGILEINCMGLNFSYDVLFL